MGEFIQNIFNGLVASGVYLLVALGITVVFGLTRLINFAHGQFLVFGAFVAFTITGHGGSFWFALLVSLVAGGILGYLSERLLFRFTLTNPLNGLIIGLGLLIVLEAITSKIWGNDSVSVRGAFSGFITAFDASFAYGRLLVLAIAVVLGGASLLALQWTTLGRRLRAAHENPIAAAHVGINVGRMITAVFVVGSALAGAAGALLGTLYPIGPDDGASIILKGFAVALLGGLGSVPGAVIASLVYGLGETMVAGYGRTEFVPFFTYGLIVAVLVFRPTGLYKHSAASDFKEDSDSNRARSSRTTEVGQFEKSILAIAALLITPICFALSGTAFVQVMLTLAILYGIQVYALATVYHTSGIMSLSHNAFMAVGAYSAALLGNESGMGLVPCLLLAALAGSIAGAVHGWLVARCRGHYMFLVSLAFSSLVLQFVKSAKTITNGDQGLTILNGLGSIGGISLDSTGGMFAMAYMGLLLAVFVYWVVPRTAFGRRLISIRENEILARGLGLRVSSQKVAIFALSGAISAVGGVLFLYQQQIITPNSFEVFLGVQFTIMVVLGGRALLGPGIGVAILVLFPELIGLDPVNRQLAFGIILIIVVLALRRGVGPTLAQAWNHLQPLLARTFRATSRGAQLPIKPWAPDAATETVCSREFPEPLDFTAATAKHRERAVLRAEGVTVRFGTTTACNNVSLSIYEGEVLGLIGPNGSGKTTLLRAISGWRAPNAGEIWWEGRRISGWSADRIARSGLVMTSQQNMVFPGVTVQAALRMAGDCVGGTRSAGGRWTVSSVIDLLHLEGVRNTLVGDLSTGHLRKVGIGLALVTNPKLLLLDEPAAGLNPLETAEFANVIRTLRDKSGIPVGLIDHDMSLIMPLCERIVVLEGGRNLANAPPAEIATDRRVIEVYLGAPLSFEAAR